jgi:hypothetical protein
LLIVNRCHVFQMMFFRFDFTNKSVNPPFHLTVFYSTLLLASEISFSTISGFASSFAFINQSPSISIGNFHYGDKTFRIFIYNTRNVNIGSFIFVIYNGDYKILFFEYSKIFPKKTVAEILETKKAEPKQFINLNRFFQ